MSVCNIHHKQITKSNESGQLVYEFEVILTVHRR